MKALAPNVTVDLHNAEGQSDKQLAQAETAINSDTKANFADPSLSGAVLRRPRRRTFRSSGTST